jgi:hypothetical protein
VPAAGSAPSNDRITCPRASRISSFRFCAGFFSQYVKRAGLPPRIASPGLNRCASAVDVTDALYCRSGVASSST